MDIVLLNDGIAAGNTTCAIEMVSMTPGNGQSQAADNVTVTGWFNGSDLKGPFRLQNEVSCSESRPKWICGAAFHAEYTGETGDIRLSSPPV